MNLCGSLWCHLFFVKGKIDYGLVKGKIDYGLFKGKIDYGLVISNLNSWIE